MATTVAQRRHSSLIQRRAVERDDGVVRKAVEHDDGVVRKPLVPGSPTVSIRYMGSGRLPFVRQLSPDFVATAAPEPDFDYTVPTYLAFRRAQGREVAGPFASIRSELDFDYHGCYTLERQQLQDVLIRDVVGAGTKKDNPWAIFTAGAMGAGKGHVMDWLCAEGYFPMPDVVTVDPDRFRCELPEWSGYLERDPATAGFMTHRESGYMVEISQAAAMDMNKNVWIDGSLRDGQWYSRVFEKIRETRPHYRIAIFHVSAPWETVIARAASRATSTGRVVPEAELRASFEQVPRSVELLAPLADFTAHIENLDTPRLASLQIRGDPVATTSCDWLEVRDRFAALPCLQRQHAEPWKSRSFVEGLVSAHPVLVFSKSYCSYCKRVKKILDAELGGGEFHCVELDTMTAEYTPRGGQPAAGVPPSTKGDAGVALQLELCRMTGQRSVPQVFVLGRFVGGCAEVQELQQKGQLRSLLASATNAQRARRRSMARSF